MNAGTPETDPLLGSIRSVRERSAVHALPHVATIVHLLKRDPSLFATQTIGRYLSERPRLGSADRGIIRDLAFTYIRWQLRLDHAVKTIMPEAPVDTRVETACSALLLMHGYSLDVAVQALPESLVDAEPQTWLPRVDATIRDLDPLRAATPADFAVRASIPEWIVCRLFGDYGSVQARAIMLASRCRAPVGLRVNTLKTDRAAVLSKLRDSRIPAEPSELSPCALRLDEDVNIRTHAVYRDGLIEVQDEGSQLIALACRAAPGMRVVDACAGAGGKTLALAAAMGNTGAILALDADTRRLERLKERASRAGVSIARAAHSRDRSARTKYDCASDIVLVDAPCSGSGTWRRVPDGPYRLSPDDIARFAQEQHGILDDVAHMVKPGGTLVYATCSLFRQENDDVVAAWIERNPDFRVSPVKRAGVSTPETIIDGPFLRITPESHGTDGFFVAKMTRGEECDT